jgi:hypothetical protein
LQNLDSDGSQYIFSKSLDEQSHAQFLNAYLSLRGAESVNFDQFRIPPSSKARGAIEIGRLTNLTQLSVDTSGYSRYRSSINPDFGATFPQANPALASGQFSAIPKTDADFASADHAQGLANTAAFRFGFIEQGGASLYDILAQQASDAAAWLVLQVTRLAAISGTMDGCRRGERPPGAQVLPAPGGPTSRQQERCSCRRL